MLRRSSTAASISAPMAPAEPENVGSDGSSAGWAAAATRVLVAEFCVLVAEIYLAEFENCPAKAAL